jgi:hypothetical protein
MARAPPPGAVGDGAWARMVVGRSVGVRGATRQGGEGDDSRAGMMVEWWWEGRSELEKEGACDGGVGGWQQRHRGSNGAGGQRRGRGSLIGGEDDG